ncbi:MAG: DUF1844 domain-containing protein [Promethearchaeota archaeon]
MTVAKDKKKPKAERTKSTPEPGETSVPEKEESGPQMMDISALPVWQLLPLFIRILDSVAWQKMGLIVNPMTQEIDKDLVQARAAIDSYEALLGQLKEHLEPEAKKALESRLADLKLNFSTQA